MNSNCNVNILMIIFFSIHYGQSHFIEWKFGGNFALPPPSLPISPAIAAAAAAAFTGNGDQQTHYFSSGRQHPQRKLSEVEQMVDITNDLAYRIIYLHSISNRNNYVFSPTSLASVAVALYEGAEGRSASELQQALRLPWNRDVIRIGFRDIHRRLRTYLFCDENPLHGLSLNRENVTITQEYENILKFYGYDLGIDMISSDLTNHTISIMPEQNNTSKTPSTLSIGMRIDTVETTQPSSTSIATTTEESSSTYSTKEETTDMITSNVEDESTTEPLNEIETTSSPTDDLTTTTIYTESAMNPLADDSTTTASIDPQATTSISVVNDNQTIISLPKRSNRMSTFADIRQKIKQQRFSREKRHFLPSSLLFGPNKYLTFSLDSGKIPPPPVQRTSSSFFPEYRVYDDLSYNQPNELPKRPEIHHIFYLNAQQTVQTSYKVYNSVLNYAYLDVLRSSVLELDLDSKFYTLMLIVPSYDFDLDYVISSLKFAPTLRVIRREMRPRWVQAIIPDFKLKGNIFLTNDLQNMNILEIFEPTRADLRRMTDETDIYVKHVEQSMNINIRTRPIDQLKRDFGPSNKPIEISVNHPFLFFIVDKELNVATIAGRIINPLNVRIQ